MTHTEKPASRTAADVETAARELARREGIDYASLTGDERIALSNRITGRHLDTVDNPNSRDAGHRFAAPLDAGDTMAGADVPVALAVLGVTNRLAVLGLAFQLGVSARTIYRWRRGDSRPNRANFEALREYVARRQASLVHAQPCSRAGDRLAALRTAWNALITDVMRAHEAELAEQVAAFLRDRGAVERARQGW